MIEQIFMSFSLCLLVVVFAAAGLAKIRAIDTLEGVIQNFRILPSQWSRPLSFVLPPAEIAVAAALTVPATRVYGAAAAAALLCVFTLAIAINLYRGRREIDCGCFSSELKQTLSGWLVARNVVLTACAVFLIAVLANPDSVQTTWSAWLLGAAGVGLSALLYLTAISLASVAATAARRRAVVGNS